MLSGGQAQLMSLLHAQGAAHALRVVTQLRIAERLRAGPCSARDSAEAVGVDAAKIHRVMRALACFGIFVEHQDGTYSLGDAGRALVDDQSMQAAVMYLTEPDILQAWMGLKDAVVSGAPVFSTAHGHSFYEHLREHKPIADALQVWMSGIGRFHGPVILEAYDFTVFDEVVDIGGGRGDLLIGILMGNPRLHGVLLDQPEVVRSAREHLYETIGSRLRFVEGSFFDISVPGADLYMLKNVIHNWGDSDALRILRRCREGMRKEARLLLIEHVMPAGPGFHMAKLLDLFMMITTGGLERTESQYQSLIEGADLTVLRHVRTPSPLALLECAPK